MTYPNVYATQTGPLALSSLDANFLYAVDIANGALSATAGGTADAITATYSPAPAALVAGLTLYLRAASANATTTPQFSPNGLTGKVIVKNNNQALAVGDIAGAGHWLHLVYDATNGVWELINPATSASVVLTGGTANGVAYLNASKVLTTGTALTFDGTNFATTGTATATKLIPTGTSVTGNGLYLPAANSLGLSTNGTNAVYIDSSQNVGIGTSSPTKPVTVKSASGDGVAVRLVANASEDVILDLFNSAGTTQKASIASDINSALKFNTVNTERMRIDSSGNVGIGYTTPGQKLEVAGNNFQMRLGQGGAIGSYDIGRNPTDGIFKFYGNQTGTVTYTFGGVDGERMRIDPSGNVLVGTTTNTNSSKVVSSGVIESTTGGFRFPDGTTQTTAATAGSVSSVNGKTGTVQSVVIAGTAVASTSGTSIDFTALPSWVKRITVMFNGVSTNSTSNYLIQLGTGSTTFTTSGYVSSCRTAVNTSGFLIVDGPTAASLVSGAITLTSFSGNTWVSAGVLQISGGGAYYSSGVIALAAQLTAVRITSVTPDTFDAGSINILYE